MRWHVYLVLQLVDGLCQMSPVTDMCSTSRFSCNSSFVLLVYHSGPTRATWFTLCLRLPQCRAFRIVSPFCLPTPLPGPSKESGCMSGLETCTWDVLLLATQEPIHDMRVQRDQIHSTAPCLKAQTALACLTCEARMATLAAWHGARIWSTPQTAMISMSASQCNLHGLLNFLGRPFCPHCRQRAKARRRSWRLR